MILATLVIGYVNGASAQSVGWQWGKTEASTFSENGKKIAVDELGYSYSAGTFTGTITVGGTTYTSYGGSDILLVKYNAAGTRVWSKQFGSSLNDDISSLQYDKAGYLYINGTFLGASFQYGSGSIPNTTAGNLEVYLLRLDAAGNVKWGFHPQGNGQDYAGNVYSNGASVIITGNFQSPSIQFGSVSMSNASFRSMFLARLDSTGVVQWAKQFGNGYIDAGYGVSMDNAGAIYLTGDLGSPSLTLGTTTLTRLGAGGTFDIFIAKFDGAGNPIWAKSAAGTGTEEPIDMVTDEKGNSYITGYFKSASINFSGTTLSNPSSLEQFFIARYDSTGNLSWVKKSSTDVQSRGLDISLASDNKIFAAGYYSGASINFNTALTNSGSNDGFVVQYDSLGTVTWNDKIGGTGDDKAAGVAGTSCGGVITGEFSSAAIQLGALSIPNVSSGTYDFYTARFSSTFPYSLPVDTLRACGTEALLDAGAGYASYAWNTLALTQQITADVSGRYVVTVFNQNGCVASDSVYVSIVSTNIIQNDTIVCKGSPIHLAIDSAWMKGKLFHSFTKNMNAVWNVAVTTIPDARYRMVVSGTWAPSIWPTERLDAANVFKTADNSFVRKWQSPTDLPASFTLNGTYIRPQADVYLTDHVYDYYFSTPVGTQFNIGFNEVVLSDNSGALSFDLYAMNNPVTVHWSTGATSNSIDVAPTSTTTYYVTITDGISSCTDSVKVTILDAPNLILPDTLKVCGDSVELDAGTGASTYAWSTGATTQKLIAYANGKYTVTAANALGCSRIDSVYVSLVKAVIQQNDTSVCKGSAMTLTAQTSAGWSYAWSNSVTGASTNISPLVSTKYFLKVSDGIGQCTDSIQVTVLDLPQATLPDTLKICGTSAILDAGSGFSSYQWSNGASTQTISVTASGKYFVTVTNASGCSSIDSVVVSLITANILQNDTAVCKGSALALSAVTGTGYNYSWSTGAITNSTSINPMVSSKYFLSVNDGIGTCMDSILVSVLALPQPMLPDTIKSCTASVLLDAGTGFNSYNWSNGSNNQTLTVTASGKYYVTVTNASGCTAIDSVYVSIVSADILQRDTAICKGSNLTLQAATNPLYTYSWSTGANGSSILVRPLLNTKYYLQTSNGIHSCTDSVNVVVNQLPQAALADTIKVCGSQVSLDAGAGFSSYMWNTGASSQTITVLQRGTYKVTITDAKGCSAPDSIFVSLVKADILQKDTAICKGTSISLQAYTDPAYLYNWSGGQTSNSILVSPVINTKYYLHTSDGIQTCSDSVLVSVLTIDTTVTVNGSTTTCAGGSVQLSAVAGYTYQWYKNGQPVPGAVNRILSASQSGSYKVKLFNSNGCSDSSNAYTVTITPLPVVSLNTLGPVNVCEGSSIALSSIVTANAAGTVQYQWYLNGAVIPGATLATYTTSAAGNYSVSVINSIGCSANSLPVAVVISLKPVISLQPSATSSFCKGASTVLRSSVNAGNSSIASYQWYKNAVLINGANADTLTVNAAGQYNLVVTNSNGCSSISSSVTVTEVAIPVGSIIPPAVTKICRGVYAILQATGGTNYNWYLNGSLIAGANASVFHATEAGNYSVEVYNGAGCSSMGTNTVSLSVIETPKPDFKVLTKCAGSATVFTNMTSSDPADIVNYTWSTGDGNSFTSTDLQYIYAKGGQFTVSLSAASTACPFQPISKTVPVVIEQSRPGIAYAPINAIEGKPVQLQARNFGVQYQWTPATGLSNRTIAAPIATNTNPQTYLVNIYTATGCITTDTQLVRLFKEREIYVPTAFTPNNDGKNDRLYPILAGVSQLTYFRVYNRWGNLVFETRQTGASSGWDGTYKGQAQPTETYVWVAEGIDIDGKPVKRNGTSLLIR